MPKDWNSDQAQPRHRYARSFPKPALGYRAPVSDAAGNAVGPSRLRRGRGHDQASASLNQSLKPAWSRYADHQELPAARLAALPRDSAQQQTGAARVPNF